MFTGGRRSLIVRNGPAKEQGWNSSGGAQSKARTICSATCSIVMHCAPNCSLPEMDEALDAHLNIARTHAVGNGWAGPLRELQTEDEQSVLRTHMHRAQRSLVSTLLRERVREIP
jgi:hypothetical protein